MNDELLLLRGTLDEAMSARFPADWEPAAEYAFEADAWGEAVELGWDQIALPDELGGLGESAEVLAMPARACGRNRYPVPLVESVLGRAAIAAAGLEQPPEGDLVTIAPAAFDGALPAGDRLSGRASRVPWGREARWAVLGDGPIALCDLAAPGVVVGHGANLAGEPRDEIAFESVPAERGELPHPGWLGGRASLARSAQIAGALAASLRLTHEYTGARKQFGRPLARFQMVGAHLASMAAEGALLDAALEDAVRAYEAGDGAVSGDCLRVVAARAATAAARSAHQSHGAIGVTREYRLWQYTTRLWSWREEFGDEFTAARALGAAVGGGADLWDLSTPAEVAA